MASCEVRRHSYSSTLPSALMCCDGKSIVFQCLCLRLAKLADFLAPLISRVFMQNFPCCGKQQKKKNPFLRRMILRLAVLLCASGAAAALLPTPLRASPHRHTRARKLVATEFGFLETVKEKMTQLTDLRICRASHILVKGNDTATLERIAEWKREIGNDEELFAKFATEHSTCPSRTRGGDLGYFPRGKMVMEFDRVVFNEEPGAVYGPVRTDFGNHLIFLHSCRREGDIPVKRPRAR